MIKLNLKMQSNYSRRNTRVIKPQLQPTQVEPDDFFLQSIKKKGFCHGAKPDQLRSADIISIEDLESKIGVHMNDFARQDIA